MQNSNKYSVLFVPFVRLQDPERSVYVLRGDRLLYAKGPASFRRMAYDYRVRWFFVEPEAYDTRNVPADTQRELAAAPFALVARREFAAGERRVGLLVYRYSGPWADVMEDIPLNLPGAKTRGER